MHIIHEEIAQFQQYYVNLAEYLQKSFVICFYAAIILSVPLKG